MVGLPEADEKTELLHWEVCICRHLRTFSSGWLGGILLFPPWRVQTCAPESWERSREWNTPLNLGFHLHLQPRLPLWTRSSLFRVLPKVNNLPSAGVGEGNSCAYMNWGASDLGDLVLSAPDLSSFFLFPVPFLLSQGPSAFWIILFKPLGFSFLCFAVSYHPFYDYSLPKCGSHAWDLISLCVFEGVNFKRTPFSERNR